MSTSGRQGSWMLMAALVVGLAVSALWVAPAGAVLSDGDCQALLAGGGDSSEINRGSTSDPADFAQQSQNYASMAENVSNRKLQRALLSLSGIYAEAGRAGSVNAATLVLTKRARPYGKALTAYSKAVNRCLTRNLTTTSSG